MTLRAKIAYTVIDSTWLALGLSVGITIGLFLALLPVTISGSLNSVLVLVMIMVASAIVQFYLFRTQAKYKAWTRIPHHLSEINNLYRHVLSSLYLSGSQQALDDQVYVAIEKEILDSVCQKISDIFRLITDAPCRTIVYLLVPGPDNSDTSKDRFCFTWATSELSRKRAKVQTEESYPLSDKENTRFVAILNAMAKRHDPEYFCADITKVSEYHDSLPDAAEHYRSVLVYPIFCDLPTEDDEGGAGAFRVVGFLSVDSSKNRLSKSPAKKLLSAFADQMFNFISLMRREYRMQSTANAEKSEKMVVTADSISK